MADRAGLLATLLLAAVLAGSTPRARAATIQQPLPGLVGARAAAMGDAYVAAPTAGPGHFHNPAALSLLRDVRLFAQTNVTSRDTVEMDPKGIAYGWRRWGMAWGNRIAEDTRGIADYTYLSAGVGANSRVALGVAAKFWRSHPWPRFQALGGSPSYDIGALVAASAEWTFGARVSQLTRGARPRAAEAGMWREGDDYALGASVAASTEDGVRTRVGVEWRPAPRLAFRGGARGVAPTAGVGLALGASDVDLTWTRYEGVSLLIVGVSASLAR